MSFQRTVVTGGIENVAGPGIEPENFHYQGRRSYQNEYDQMAYEEKAVSGHATAVKLAQSLSTKFERMENALKTINLAIGSKYADFQTTSSMQECCRESGLSFNSRFNAMVRKMRCHFS
ncbi:hypothetical protein FSP39_024260 [Pinctada imbricata]|uniref:Uncharacterized protein n=1 Tax=Pinctada imbricata TaxID=66713 RepID=A0AA89BZV8_PINIB|nr:hypothetical protein FSP39_024260 [Pinctada imbricata]